MTTDLIRCQWCSDDPLYQAYHDNEWGIPVYDERTLFEFLILEGAQAGLAWITVLKKREGYRQAFDHFDADKIAAYNEQKVEALLSNPGIIRNRRKVLSTIQNAQAYCQLRDAGDSFSDWLWSFVGGEPRLNHFTSLANIPTQTPESEAMSKALKKRGFNFVGPTICYAFMQATGMVNDHTTDCFKHPDNL